MAKRIKFTATFADGSTVTRTSDRKEYTHAWQIIYRRGPVPASWAPHYHVSGHPEGSLGRKEGFATSEVLARAAARSEFSSLTPSRKRYSKFYGELRQYTLVVAEVVAVTRTG